MRIIGIDPGLTRCGVGVVTAGPGRAVTFEHVEVLKSPADASTPSRLLQIGSSIARMLDGQEIGAIALERVFAQQNLPSVMGVAQISGVVMYLAAQRGIPVTLYTPNEVKSQVTGYGAADKAQVGQMVARLLRLDAVPQPADASDALALAVTHAWNLNRGRASSATVQASSETPAQRAWREAEAKSGKRRGSR